MTHPIVSLIDSIKDKQSAKIRVMLKSGDPAQLDCTYMQAEAPLFALVFPPKTLPEELEINQTYSVEIITGGDPLLFKAVAQSFQDDATIIMQATESMDSASFRELQRVELSTTIVASSGPASDDSPYSWEISGSTIDLSGTGVLCIFPKELESNSSITITIELPNIEKSVQCKAQVIRTRKLRKERYQTALQFDSMTEENSASLIAACLHEQRNKLRQDMDTA